MRDAHPDADESAAAEGPGATARPPSHDSLAPASMADPFLPLRAVGAGKTDVGRQRKHNEDAILVRPELRLFVVADGMGGHNAGNVASRLVTTSIANFFEATVEDDPEPDPEDGPPQQAKRLADAVRKANRDVHEISTTVPQHHGMGSTVVGITFEPASALTDARVHIAHVGDSRCYRFRAGRIQQLTRDHSLVNDALDLKPDLTEAELARLPKNIITRALGMKDHVQVDMKSVPAEPGDMFLLCSDGLSGLVQSEQMEEACDISSDLQEICDLLVAMANDAGGTDNISALLVRVETDPDAEPVALGLPPLPEDVRDALEAGGEVELGPTGAEADAEAEETDDEPADGDDAPASNLPPVICSSCGFLVPGDDNFCGECGKPVG